MRKKCFPERRRTDSLCLLQLQGDRWMRGTDRQTGRLFNYLGPEAMVPQDHPLRVIRPLLNAALERLSAAFCQIYSEIGRPSIPPEKLLRALLLQAFFSVRSERQLMEQLTYNMLFLWFVGLAMDAPVWDVTVFTKNRERLLAGDIAGAFLRAILADPQVRPMLSDEHFSVDGTLIEAWASMKASGRRMAAVSRPPRAATASATSTGRSRATRRTPRPPTRTSACTRRPRDRRPSCATWGMWSWRTVVVWWWRPARRSPPAPPSARQRRRWSAPSPGQHRITLGTDKAYDTLDFVGEMRRLGVTRMSRRTTSAVARPLTAAPHAMRATR
jgi:transposase